MNENDALDVAVIGAGPAGLTAGLYAARAGLSVAIYERNSPGGQLAQTERVENYPGFAEGADGFELAWAMKEQAEHFGAIIVSEEVTAVDFSGEVQPLTPGEIAVLKAFARHPRQPLSRDKQMEMARGREYEAFDRSLDVQVSRLRKLIEPDPSKPRYLQTVWGLGYVFIPDGHS